MSVFEGRSYEGPKGAAVVQTYPVTKHASSPTSDDNVRQSSSPACHSILQGDVCYSYQNRGFHRGDGTQTERLGIFACVNGMDKNTKIQFAGISINTFLQGKHNAKSPHQIQVTGLASIMYNGLVEGHPGDILVAEIPPHILKKAPEPCTSNNAFGRTLPVMKPVTSTEANVSIETFMALFDKINPDENMSTDKTFKALLEVDQFTEEHAVNEAISLALKLKAEKYIDSTKVRMHALKHIYNNVNYEWKNKVRSALMVARSLFSQEKQDSIVVIGKLMQQASPGKPTQILLFS